MPEKIQIKAIISGRVQGVFYRVETKNYADELGGIRGYVKNLPTGSVEAVFRGKGSTAEKMVKWCHKGPAASRVKNVLTEQMETTEDFTTFEIRY